MDEDEMMISLYKGKLHEVPEDAPPRRWEIPKPKISQKHFQTLILNRSKTLQRRLQQQSSLNNNNNNNNSNHSANAAAADDDLDVNEAGTNVITATSDKEKRKNEIKERLEILNERKHGLVQVLKQVLSAEGQLKKLSSNQGNSGRPPLPLQVETTATDSGSMTRINTPRMASGGNPCSQRAVDGSNPNSQSRQLPRMNITSPSSDSQRLTPTSNMMPHRYRATMAVAGSPARFTPTTPRHGRGQGQGPCSTFASGTSYRATMAVAGSPARFTPSTPRHGQGPSSTFASGTSYVASSPSPAASGGTSAFRDARLSSPWN